MRQKGNALFLILIAVALFAALSYAITQGGRGGGGIDREQTALAAAEIVQYGQMFKTAVDRMRLVNGCKEDQIDFSLSGGVIKRIDGTLYNLSNSKAPSDFRCHVFRSEGGGITAKLLPAAATIPLAGLDTAYMHPQSFLPILERVAEIGSSIGSAGSDLTIRLGRLTKEACTVINEQLGVENPGGNPPEDTACRTNFTGTYSNCSEALNVTPIRGKMSFCVRDTVGNRDYQYFQVLIPR